MKRGDKIVGRDSNGEKPAVERVGNSANQPYFERLPWIAEKTRTFLSPTEKRSPSEKKTFNGKKLGGAAAQATKPRVRKEK